MEFLVNNGGDFDYFSGHIAQPSSVEGRRGKDAPPHSCHVFKTTPFPRALEWRIGLIETASQLCKDRQPRGNSFSYFYRVLVL